MRQRPHHLHKGPYFLNFTPRERELIRMFIEEGKSTKEAAWDLHLSVKTVETHRNNIMQKLRDVLDIPEVTYVTAIDMALYAVSNDLVDLTVIERKYRRSFVPCPS